MTASLVMLNSSANKEVASHLNHALTVAQNMTVEQQRQSAMQARWAADVKHQENVHRVYDVLKVYAKPVLKALLDVAAKVATNVTMD